MVDVDIKITQMVRNEMGKLMTFAAESIVFGYPQLLLFQFCHFFLALVNEGPLFIVVLPSEPPL